ncbi:hypothetical protein [Ponticoccus litoralis]|uniref:MarR family transcriptional regulator n=1 Tax=Ponticoccus litoralis TaxID=422297 RepID=A0AAW9SHL4_9RHOB
MAHDAVAFRAHVRAFSELLIVLRRELDNDLDKGLIMAVIAERHYAALDKGTGASTGVNTHSVSLYSDIPRETVRRKVKDLISKGWLVSDGRGNLSPTEQAARDLGRGTAATLRFMRAVSPPEQERK